MQRLQSTPALQEFPQLSRLHCFSTQNQGVVADYLAHLRARHDAPAMQDATLTGPNGPHTTTPWRRSKNAKASTGDRPWTPSARPPSTGFGPT
jgi:hypothetical protein